MIFLYKYPSTAGCKQSDLLGTFAGTCLRAGLYQGCPTNRFFYGVVCAKKLQNKEGLLIWA